MFHLEWYHHANIVQFIHVIWWFVAASDDITGAAADSEPNGEIVTKTAKPRKRKTADTQDGEVNLFIFSIKFIL